MTLYLSWIRLARNPSAQALSPLLAPADPAARRSAQHNLLWSVFADGPDRRRDFLWREEPDGSFLTLSARKPTETDLFQPHRIREFAPQLSVGDRLEFQLRCNATRTEKTGALSTGGKEKKRHIDLVMDMLHALPGRRDLPDGSESHRAPERMRLAREVGQAWLSRQGDKAGFRVLDAEVLDYSTEVLSGYRGPRKGQPQFGILDLAGRIELTEPSGFLNALGRGFGRAKAFGCGLMLIRRAP
ncbi:type I-E CRISPR-associated protein Cas6/Cse3/CasE [Cereibacter sphaeroides]|uniref:type I-E CRISPR-associated protein Cas6/Cse3/CasE n=1 Tax=Cereibacter sphaeroides TaxID=1063 RepID=UPI003FCE9E6D